MVIILFAPDWMSGEYGNLRRHVGLVASILPASSQLSWAGCWDWDGHGSSVGLTRVHEQPRPTAAVDSCHVL
eukprot:754019-Hanusia_phi.AAC.2